MTADEQKKVLQFVQILMEDFDGLQQLVAGLDLPAEIKWTLDSAIQESIDFIHDEYPKRFPPPRFADGGTSTPSP